MTTKRKSDTRLAAPASDPEEDRADLELMNEAELEYRAGKGGPIESVFARVRSESGE